MFYLEIREKSHENDFISGRFAFGGSVVVGRRLAGIPPA
jgi:hypothetical protein